ncbi:MFS transporter [Streptomyces sp. NPDC048277]|uniref:MFS transporter n=1 Tax=Streptomyces sp. NPDC048277 TaxID=3155027 RepID=UPI0033EB1340
MLDVLRVRDFRLVAVADLLSGLGDWLLLVAAPYFVLRLTGSTMATGLTLAAETLPALVLGPVAGVFADRCDRRRTMLAIDVLRAATVALMLLVHHPGQVWLIYVALIGESGLGQFFDPARRALIPALVGRGPRLAAANSLTALVSGTVRLVGGPAGGALYALAGFGPVVALDAASYLASAILIAAIRHRPGPVSPQRQRGTVLRRFADDLRAGAAHLRVTPGLPVVFATAAIFLLGNAALTALLVPFTGTVLHAGAGTLGMLFAALGVGYLAGAPLSRAAAARFSDRRVMITSLAALSAVFAVTFHTHDIGWALVLFVLIGPPGVCFLVAVDTYLARRTPDALLGRVGSAYGMIQAAATLAGMLGGAVLGQQVGIGVTADLAALCVAVSAAVALLIPRHSTADSLDASKSSLAAPPERSADC